MRRVLCTTMAILVLTGLAYGFDTVSLMTSGNAYYEQGEFDKAIQEYQKILAADFESASLHYNLGCAYFNKKVYGKAILHFEKAKTLAPRDADILHNLEYTKLFLKDRFDLPEPMPLVAWYNSLRQSLSLAELQTIEISLFSLLVLSIVLFRILRDRSVSRSILLISYGFGILFLLAAGWLGNRALSVDDQQAVLLLKEADVSSAPLSGSSTLFVIHEGTTAEILSSTDSWYEIRLVDGKTGWIAHEAVGIF